MRFGEGVICAYCKKKIEGIPFTCSYCGKDFCSDHRLPEKHECEELKRQKKHNDQYYVEKFGEKKNEWYIYHAPGSKRYNKLKKKKRGL